MKTYFKYGNSMEAKANSLKVSKIDNLSQAEGLSGYCRSLCPPSLVVRESRSETATTQASQWLPLTRCTACGEAWCTVAPRQCSWGEGPTFLSS